MNRELRNKHGKEFENGYRRGVSRSRREEEDSVCGSGIESQAAATVTQLSDIPYIATRVTLIIISVTVDCT